ncbi:hypothetical protein B0T18DRAFT_405910 [Schizothecium vesticola]|uniref:Uncharacterized protein n=1 Tax=Schizothecium vesticola TaxID=314040 RepID=A0AA40F160_9PEZI|nr:hypothetical protein B0T18DRAFT_405910 [Schizothecium vesticola]
MNQIPVKTLFSSLGYLQVSFMDAPSAQTLALKRAGASKLYPSSHRGGTGLSVQPTPQESSNNNAVPSRSQGYHGSLNHPQASKHHQPSLLGVRRTMGV